MDHVFEVIETLHKEGTAVLLVEQNVASALAVASRAYVLAEGRIELGRHARRTPRRASHPEHLGERRP